MANEFIARKGLIVPSGSILVTSGSVTALNFIGTASAAVSSSHAVTASYALNAGAGAGFPFSGSAVITGSLNVTQGVTASFFKGDGSQLTNLPPLEGASALRIDNHSYEADGVTTNYNLSQSYYTADGLVVSVGGIAYAPLVDYTVVGSTLSFVEVPPSQSNIIARAFVAVTSGSVNILSGSFVGNLIGTSSWANNAVTASYATVANFALTPSGTSGTSGTAGSAGSSGTSGSTGTSGSSGSTGTSGSSGTTGSSGSAGTSGLSGSSGTSGTGGTSGSSGTSGTAGSSGTSGTSGSSGTSGTSGANGSSGSSGSSGATGASGSSGSSGTSGANGAPGSSGTSGATGASGSSGTSGTGFTTISNAADNRVLTSTGAANAANAEANLTFDGSVLTMLGNYLSINNQGYIRGDSSGYLVLQGGSTGTLFNNSSNGATLMTILNGGNVGIGTTSPNAPLVIFAGEGTYNAPTFGSTNRGAIHIRNLTSDRRNAITFSSANSDNAQAGIYVHQDNSAGTHMYFATTDSYATGPQARVTILNNGNVGIGTTSPGARLQVVGEINSSGGSSIITVSDRSTSGTGGFYRQSGVNRLWDGTAGDVITWNSSGNVGIGTTAPAYKLDINGKLRTLGILNSTDITEIMVGAVGFANNEANRAFDIRFGNTSFWGYLEVEITSTFNFQNSPGKLTKIFSVGTNPNNLIYSNESRIVDAMGPITSNIAIGEFGWDAANSTYRIPVSHIVSTGNVFSVRVKMFSLGNGAQTVFDNISLSSVYTLTALSRHYPYYNERLGIGTASPNGLLSITPVSTGTRKIVLYDGGVNNNFQFYGFGIEDSTLLYSTYTTSDDHVFFAGTGTSTRNELMRVKGNGNVGIGTTSPSYKLDVSGDIGLTNEVYLDNGKYIRFRRSSGGLSIQTLGIESGTDDVRLLTTGDFKILNGSLTQLVTVKNSGNVGIGTTSPTATLTVVGPNATGTFISAQNDGAGGFVGVRVNASSFPFNHFFFLNGYVGIGTTSPARALDVSGSGAWNASGGIRVTGNNPGIVINDGPSGQGWLIANGVNTGNDGFLGLAYSLTGNAHAIVVDTNRRVGIGTTSPDYTLRVQGTIFASSDIIAYSDARAKENVVTLDAALDKITNLRGVYYTHKDDEQQKRNVGVIAQEVLDVVPELVSYSEESDEYAVKYQNITALLIEAIKEQQHTIQSLQNRIETLEKK